MRAVSTVLDVSLCLLFVTASALTLVGTPLAGESNSTEPNTADEIAELLTTTTASVTYEIADGNRTAHDTLAGLLASATLGDASSASVLEFRSAVTRRVDRTLRPLDADVQVVAVPLPDARSKAELDSTRDGAVSVGTPPPASADVHAATVAVRGVRLTVRTWSG